MIEVQSKRCPALELRWICNWSFKKVQFLKFKRIWSTLKKPTIARLTNVPPTRLVSIRLGITTARARLATSTTQPVWSAVTSTSACRIRLFVRLIRAASTCPAPITAFVISAFLITQVNIYGQYFVSVLLLGFEYIKFKLNNN